MGRASITGAHAIIHSKNADADRAFLRDVLKFPSTDAGGGWLIFGLPPCEVAVHPSDRNDEHELYLMCDDIDDLVGLLREKDVECSPVHRERWGLLTRVTLPGGGRLGMYEPTHPRAPGTGRSTGAGKRAPARTSRGTRSARRGGARRPGARSR